MAKIFFRGLSLISCISLGTIASSRADITCLFMFFRLTEESTGTKSMVWRLRLQAAFTVEMLAGEDAPTIRLLALRFTAGMKLSSLSSLLAVYSSVLSLVVSSSRLLRFLEVDVEGDAKSGLRTVGSGSIAARRKAMISGNCENSQI